MRAYTLEHLSHRELEHALPARISAERRFDTVTLAYIAEFDQRRLYLPAGYSSMYAFCVERLHLSEGSAFKRITAARTARQYPVLFELMAHGRLNVSDVVVLSRWLTPANATELIQEAAGKTRSEIEALLARRFPQTEALPLVCRTTAAHGSQLSPGTVLTAATEHRQHTTELLAAVSATKQMAPAPRLTPIAPERNSVQITLGKSGHEDLEALRNLLSHRIPSGDLNEIAEYAFKLARKLAEKRKFAATSKPRAPRAHPPKSARTTCAGRSTSS